MHLVLALRDEPVRRALDVDGERRARLSRRRVHAAHEPEDSALGFSLQDISVRVQRSGFGVGGWGFSVQGLRMRCRVVGVGFGVEV